MRVYAEKKSGRGRVVLIFGDPGNGKTHLADALREKYGYDVISLDAVYVDFVQTRYPDLYLRKLDKVIAQHYQTIIDGEVLDGHELVISGSASSQPLECAGALGCDLSADLTSRFSTQISVRAMTRLGSLTLIAQTSRAPDRVRVPRAHRIQLRS